MNAHCRASTFMTTRLEEYALIGDGESAALVGKGGSIDWLCWPRFDSDACFAALVGREANGRWKIGPPDDHAHATWRYRENTLIVETEFVVDSGRAKLIDFMPMRDGAPSLARRVVGLQGEVQLRMDLGLRFGYGTVPPWYETDSRRLVGRVGPDLAVLYSDVPVSVEDHDATAEFSVKEGQTADFLLRHGSSTAAPPPPASVQRLLGETHDYWCRWIDRFKKPTDWPDAVKRSLITLKALINRPTGGILAAPTTSLPEVPGGSMNWDYRYSWLRDSTFALASLLNAGYAEEAEAWRDWILRTIAGTPEHVQIMYRIDGGRELSERTIDWLEGYDWSRPVRAGNGAAGQRQIDIYGELIDALHLADRAGLDGSPHADEIRLPLVNHVERVWCERGHGIWESRGEPRHYVYSKIMAWAAIDRFLLNSNVSRTLETHEKSRLLRLKQAIHGEVCDEGFHPGVGSFVQYYGGEELDASLLLIPALQFLPATDPRMIGTVARVEKELVDSGLVYRSSKARESSQGAFLACSAWLADCYLAQGRQQEARATFERLLSVRGELGLLSEEYNIRGRRLCGNYPQGLSHLSIVTTGIGLCGPVLQRGGG